MGFVLMMYLVIYSEINNFEKPQSIKKIITIARQVFTIISIALYIIMVYAVVVYITWSIQS